MATDKLNERDDSTINVPTEPIDGTNGIVVKSSGSTEPEPGTRTRTRTRTQNRTRTPKGNKRSSDGTPIEAGVKKTSDTPKTVKIEEVKADIPERPQLDKIQSDELELQSIEASAVLIMLLNAIVMTGFGDAAQINANERALIEPPLKRILARSGGELVKQVEKFSDPLLLAVGLIMWGTRVVRVNAENARIGKPSPEPEPEPAPEPSQILIPSDGDIASVLSAPAELHDIMTGVL